MQDKAKFYIFLKENIICVLISVVAGLLIHGSALLGRAIGIDTEALLYYGDDFYQGWLNSGRQGLVLLHRILYGWCDGFNGVYSGILTIIFMTLACACWIYLFRCVTGKNSFIGNIVFCLLVISHTILTEQVYFRIQSAEVCLGFAIVAFSVLLLYRVVVDMAYPDCPILSVKKLSYLVCIILLNMLAFSIYQIMVPLYIFGCVTVLLLRMTYMTNSFRPWTESVKMGVVFVISFAINEIITLIFFNGSEYLGNQIYWKTESIGTCIYQIASHIVRAGIIGRRIYFAPSFAIYMILVVIISVIYAKEKTLKKNQIIFWVIAILFTFAAPFYMTVICGGEAVIRSQLLLPFTIAFMGYFLMAAINDATVKPWLLVILIVAVNLFTISEQATLSIRLNHTDKVRYAQDEKLAYELIEKIDELQNADNSLPVVFIGSSETKFDSFCIEDGDVIGYSFFDWDTEGEPYSYRSTLRIIGFLSTLGTTYTEPDSTKMEEYYQYSIEMNSYPETDSVWKYEDAIIVKLSDRR